MRVPTDLPRRPRRSGRGRPAIIVTIIVLVLLIISTRGIAGFYTDFLWFDSLGFKNVFTGILFVKIMLAVVFTAALFVLLVVNLTVADRLAPRFRPLGPEDELVQRYKDLVGRHAAKVRAAVAAVFALILGAGQSSQWNTWILFSNAHSFGVKDPQFHKDIGFYVFRLPFWQFLVSWSFAAVVVTTFLTAVFHYLNGGIRLQASSNRVTPQVKAHLSVLFGLLALIKAAGYYFQRYNLVFSTRGPTKGATYTDVHAQLPAIRLLIVIMILAFGLFIANIRLRGWTLPVLAIGLWMLVSVVVGALYPLIIQQTKVKPSENRREAPYIADNITATRAAMGIDKIQQQKTFNYNEQLTAQDVDHNVETLRNIRLWDPALTLATYQQLQEFKQYYKINDTDVDRYLLGGQQTQTILSVRELNQADIPQNSWVNRHLQYTHGYGATLAPANAVTADGRPVFALRDVPPTVASDAPANTPTLTPNGAAVYYGENIPNFSIVDSKQPELDYERPDGSTQASSFQGKGGVSLSSTLRRAAFAARFSDWNILISGQITTKSRILYIRNIQDRIHKAAPFLKLDADPYAVTISGRIVWVQDAYTTTDRYPYGQDAQVDRLADASGLKTTFNYVRNSVKVTVDAYDGTTTLYDMNKTNPDPIVEAYRSAFPSLFKSESDIPSELIPHLRYPEDLFKVQTTMYGRYHITDEPAFYGLSDAWNVAQSPGVGPANALVNRTAQTTPNGQIIPGTARQARQDPFYLVMRLPGESQEEFQIIQPMVPQSTDDKQQNLTAFIVAKSDPGDYGQLEVFKIPSGLLVTGPAQVDALIQQNPAVSRDISLLNTNNSEADFGNILTVPVNNSLLYIRPLYVKSARNPIPEFKKAIVVYGNKVAYEDTLQASLNDIFPGIAQLTQEQGTGTGPSTPSGTSPPPPPAALGSVAQLLAEAQADFTAAQTALRAGDLATYQAKTNDAQQKTAQALAQIQGSSSSTTTTTPGSASTTTTTAPASPPSSA